MVGSENVHILYQDRVMGPVMNLRGLITESQESHMPGLELGIGGGHRIHRFPKYTIYLPDSSHKKALTTCLKGGIFKKLYGIS